MPARTIRIRSVDTNPVSFPNRLLSRPLSPADRFAKCATVVTQLYSVHLDRGTPLVAKTSWVRFIPTEMTEAPVFSAVPADASLGLGEVHEVPYDRKVLDLPDPERRAAILDWLQANLISLAEALGWDRAPLTEAYESCRRDELRFRQRGAAKTSPDRQHKAYPEFEIDGDGDGWSWVVVTDPRGAVEAESDRRDSLPTATAAGRVLKSLRWDGDTVTWTPWTDDVAPRGHDSWVGHVERFAAPR
ncbi:hypothetical protein ODJ79_11500 [Actinoplanes sp. KI2]|uniref:hypothetical protein n=1 Tax=Actinoplanes sp. KI2 TaxID=2983315 RepID=UPI0021D5DC3D|nr:hypothetical protein [Actinoplanes sp. KI2]MCU7724342.1 hypothetical protein [Actinoplanes sp. KI2]